MLETHFERHGRMRGGDWSKASEWHRADGTRGRMLGPMGGRYWYSEVNDCGSHVALAQMARQFTNTRSLDNIGKCLE